MDKKSAEMVKDWLGRYREAKWECRRLEGEYDELVRSQESVGAIKYSDMPKAANYERDLSSLMVKREKYMDRIIKARERMQEIFDEISAAITFLGREDQAVILSLRYLQLNGCRFTSWENISAKTNYGVRHIFQAHGEALENLGKILKDCS